MVKDKILVINPGSTSTKIAIFQDENCILKKTLNHDTSQIEKYDDIMDQLDLRREAVYGFLKEEEVDLNEIIMIMARGGLLPNIGAGAYRVSDEMLNTYREEENYPHASNLAAFIGREIAKPLGIETYIYDAVSSDEFDPIAKITGMPECERKSMCHVLNQKAMARKLAKKVNKKYEDLRLVVVHLGGGISIGAHKNGKIVDSIGDDAGPFSPERSGSLPVLDVINMCYDNNWSKVEMMHKVRGMGGIRAYLGTADIVEVEKMMADGNQLAIDIFHAEAYQIGKGIGSMATVLECELDYILITGGMAHSKEMVQLIEKRISPLAKVEVLPGQAEMEALNEGGLRILKGEEKPKEYIRTERKA